MENSDNKFYSNVYDYYEGEYKKFYTLPELKDYNVIVSYKGMFNEKGLAIIRDHIRVLGKNNSFMANKIFKVFVELSQNVALYSAEKLFFNEKKEIGSGAFLICENDSQFKVMSINLVKKSDEVKLVDKCNHINTLDRNALRLFRRKQRSLPQGKYGNANIGLIQIALITTNEVEYDMMETDNSHSFFSIIATISKS